MRIGAEFHDEDGRDLLRHLDIPLERFLQKALCALAEALPKRD